MGYAGQPMLVVKANRALLRKRSTFKEVKDMYLDSTDKTELEFKEISPEKLAQIKVDIRRKAKEDAWKDAGIHLLCTMVVLYGLYWIFYI
ncbi:hypothetical protein FEE95_13505 [Maribacter algarum]|uniref:Uncharacterized protein n=1 Tax=Maribacter algarum (ex Zhang et al. 2020) TaxID=2578118 RepID=A0A5S3PU84_9FLAO|nr:hypothetical protein [Maribacter algarum]TMM57493.1 hypothetical protein FEE95_13505 [Maribacter algarum]